jgi:hypothetical protein
MQPIKLIIPGNYWDTQLYSGYLYLFGDSGDLVILNWDALINEFLLKDDTLKMAANTAFLNSNLFYDSGAQLLLQDPSIKNILLARFISLSEQDLQLNLSQNRNKNISRINNPLPFPHVDSEIYYSRLYTSLKSGVFYSECSGQSVKPSHVRLWDTPTFDITASKSYTSIAFAAGSEGLFQQRFERRDKEERDLKPINISKNHCTTCKWTDQNIFATSNIQDSFFASFKKIKGSDSKRKSERILEGIIPAKEIFKFQGYSWGVSDKLYIYHDNKIDAIKYSSNKKDGTNSFVPIGELPVDTDNGELVSAEVASFGTVIEYDNAIFVIQSDNETFTIPGEPVNWRVFSKSHNYTNQLHIVYEDRLEIYSFYNDYFIDQTSKVSGIKMV